MNKNVFSLCVMGLFCSMIFSENGILCDFGVEIRPPDIQNNQKDILHQYSVNQEVFQPIINALITDPFIPPVKSTQSSQISDQSVIILPKKIMEFLIGHCKTNTIIKIFHIHLKRAIFLHIDQMFINQIFVFCFTIRR